MTLRQRRSRHLLVLLGCSYVLAVREELVESTKRLVLSPGENASIRQFLMMNVTASSSLIFTGLRLNPAETEEQ